LAFIHAKPQDLWGSERVTRTYFLKTSALFLFESVPCQFLTLVGKIYRKANGCFSDVSDEKRWMMISQKHKLLSHKIKGNFSMCSPQ
jgi:hypothetical protein